MLPDTAVAQRAATILRRLAPFVIALAIIVPGSLATPQQAAAAGPKVVIVVGPTHSATAKNIERAKSYATLARSLGATVVELYTPRATWDRVRAAAQGAKVFIYLGHGNGWPSPYAPSNTTTKNGLGLNPPSDAGTTSPVKYYGEGFIAGEIRFAAGAIVLLNHLCYASGNSEPGHAGPTWSVARQRVDNYAAGFIGAGAGAVLADGHTSLGYELKVLLGKDRNLLAAWRADPDRNGHERALASVRRPGFTTYIDPNGQSSGFYRSLTTKPGFMTASSGSSTTAAPTAALKARTGTSVTLRTGAGTSNRSLGTIPAGATLAVIGPFLNDGSGRTWAHVRTSSGKRGYVAAWYVKVTGSAVARTNVVLRKTARVTGTYLATVPSGTRVTVTGSMKDSKFRVWLQVKTPKGQVGWMAAWLMRP